MTQQEFIEKWSSEHARIQEAIKTAHNEPSAQTLEMFRQVSEAIRQNTEAIGLLINIIKNGKS